MIGQETKYEQTRAPEKTAVDILNNIQKNTPGCHPTLPSNFGKRLELAIIEGIFAHPIPHHSELHAYDPDIIIDLDTAVGDMITNHFHDCRQNDPRRRMRLTEFGMLVCGMWKALENLHIPHGACRLFHTEEVNGTIAYKLQLVIPHNNILELLEKRLTFWASAELEEQKAKEMHELYVWMKGQKEDDGTKKVLSIITEIGTDVKMLLGFAKDSMGEFATVKTKLETIWRAIRKTKPKEGGVDAK